MSNLEEPEGDLTPATDRPHSAENPSHEIMREGTMVWNHYALEQFVTLMTKLPPEEKLEMRGGGVGGESGFLSIILHMHCSCNH